MMFESKIRSAQADAGGARAREPERVVDLDKEWARTAAVLFVPPPPPPLPRTKWTRRVPHPVLIGHAASLTRY